ncbi:haloalkane dehalogenase [Kordiimonas sp. SCSIO 12610]|uniref:haloalkane dehalogenase n=1 Tax=Kordiimonas sp. SCSIO 12610 TaxID=2829597 RepID=UPI00210E9376|nr:haloalkane dehalogenase [Kordiimonas sp. SCSIO 12610]UTW54594.1 alpha/beta fold hydrolase [Kordiimonas sp. SCSIO 12610]
MAIKEGVLRTDDDRFENLPDWPYLPNYIDDLPGYEGLRAHYIDEGDKNAERVFLCLHGEPSWAYLYRHMIPHFLNSGARVVAPDFFGFGRSDKPIDDATYTFNFHRDYLLAFIERLNLKNVTLVCQDWGGLLGLTLPHDMPDRFARLIVMNTTIAIGKPAGKGFDAWRDYVANTPDFPVGQLMKRSSPHLSEAEVAAYDAPFPDDSYKAGVRRFPQLVMTDPDMNGVETSKKALEFWQNEWQGQSFMAIGMQDPVLGPPAMKALAGIIKNCPEPMEIEEGGHFVQEWGGEIAPAALKHFGDI